MTSWWKRAEWPFILVLMLLTVAGGVMANETATGILPSGDEILLELAVTPEQRRIGYMGRDRVGPNQGMLFLFDADGYHGIWMKNCKVGLDIIWLDRGLRVVDIAPDRLPCPAKGPCPSAEPGAPALYVLELAAGRVAETGLKVGDRIVVLPEAVLGKRSRKFSNPAE